MVRFIQAGTPGWAVSGIERVEIFIDGVYEFDAPYGASRGDVGKAFPRCGGLHELGLFPFPCL